MVKMAATVTAVTTMGTALAATAHADNYLMFQSPSGNIHCHLDGDARPAPIAQCQIHDYTYTVPPDMPRDGLRGGMCPEGARGGGFFWLSQGEQAFLECEYANIDSGYSGPWPTLDYGQTRSFGSLTCGSEPAGMTCSDTSTGHFFRVSRDSYQLG